MEEQQIPNRRFRKFSIALAFLFLVSVSVYTVYLAIMQGIIRIPANYRSETNPGGVAYNYQLAIIKRDFQRALDYLSPTLENRPGSAAELLHDLEQDKRSYPLSRGNCVYLVDIKREGSIATVEIWDDLAVNPFEECNHYPAVGTWNLSSSRFYMKISLEGGSWRVTDSERYFNPCWKGFEPCQR